MPNIMRAAHVFLVKVPASKLEDNPKILAWGEGTLAEFGPDEKDYNGLCYAIDKET